MKQPRPKILLIDRALACTLVMGEGRVHNHEGWRCQDMQFWPFAASLSSSSPSCRDLLVICFYSIYVHPSLHGDTDRRTPDEVKPRGHVSQKAHVRGEPYSSSDDSSSTSRWHSHPMSRLAVDGMSGFVVVRFPLSDVF
jgi:hypothetical protein